LYGDFGGVEDFVGPPGEHRANALAALGASGINPQIANGLEQVTLMNDSLNTLSDLDSDVRARLLARLAREAFLEAMKGHRHLGSISLRDQPFCWSREAIEMARRLGDPSTLAYCLILRPMVFTGPLTDIDEHLRLADEIISSARSGRSVTLLVWGLAQRHYLLLQRGDVNESLRLLDEILPLIDSLKLPILDWAAALNAADQQIRTGQYDAALRWLERADSHWPNTLVANLQRFHIYREQGSSLDETIEHLRAGIRAGDVPPLSLLPFELLLLL
jgi:tetratricopeptide (TPR) repeat protein